MRRGLALAAMSVGLIAAAGCGEDEEFIDDYNKAMRPLRKLQDDRGDARPGPQTALQQLTRQADETRKVNGDLADLEAPDDAKAHFGDLRAALRRSEKNLRDVVKAAQEGDISLQTSAQQALAKDTRDIERAQSALKQEVED